MSYILTFIIFILILNVFKLFNMKLIVLLIFENIMLCIIFLYTFFFSSSFFSFLVMLILSLFMVLDSVFGICILIISSRGTSMIETTFNTI